MRKLIYLIAVVLTITSCQQNSSNSELAKIDAADNACIECTQKVQAQLAACLKSAGSDQAKIQACNSQASKDWVAKCSAICKPGIDKFSEMEIQIGETRQAEKTNKPADGTVHMVASIDGGVVVKEPCSGNGHIRTITVNGRCYSQMCCGGQWMFFYQDRGRQRVWCTCNLSESWTVNCNGNNWIISCR